MMLSDDYIAVTGLPLARANVAQTVHFHKAVEADSDAAKHSAWSIVYRSLPETQPVVRHDDAGDALPENSGDRLTIN